MLKPFFNDVLHIPSNTYFDAHLISRSAVFGGGWGLGGFFIDAFVTALPITAIETIIFCSCDNDWNGYGKIFWSVV